MMVMEVVNVGRSIDSVVGKAAKAVLRRQKMAALNKYMQMVRAAQRAEARASPSVRPTREWAAGSARMLMAVAEPCRWLTSPSTSLWWAVAQPAT